MVKAMVARLSMVFISIPVCLLAVLSLAATGCGRTKAAASGKTVTIETVLASMCDPAGFAVPCEARTGFVSTYDRTGGNMDWGNWDPERGVGGQHILADLKGPGCLTRIWTTGCEVDEWRLYVDNDTEPRIRGNRHDLFGKQDPVLPPLADQFSGAAHTYLPVPFAHRLRIAVYAPKIAAGSRPYFQIGYNEFPAGTPVLSYPLSLSEAERSAVLRVRDSWDGVEAQAVAATAGALWKTYTAAPGSSVTVVDSAGPAVIRTLAFRLKGLTGLPPQERPRILRSLVLECRWDGSEFSSVQVPFGDFFCNGLAFRSFASIPLAYVNGTYVSRFPMPFGVRARISLRNDGSAPVTFDAWDRQEPRPSGVPAPFYLHAGWNSGMSLGSPFRILRAEGNGQYAGCYLISYGMDGSWNILEGDESFFVDGETVPSWHGTGLEDYFNGGWYYYGLFERALYGLLEKAAMRTAQYRFHLSDPVRFRKSLQMNMEFGDANRARGYMSATAYWYQDRPSPANSSIPDLGQRYPPFERVGLSAVMSELFELEKAGLVKDAIERCRYYEALFAGNAYGPMYGLRGIAYREAIEGNLAVRSLYAGLASRPDIPAEVAAQARLLHWVGDADGRGLLGAHGAGSWRLYWDGKFAGEGDGPIDFRAFPVEVSPGEHWIGAEVTPKTQGAVFSACLRTDFTNVTTDAYWEYVRQRPSGWPATGGDGWKPIEPQPSMFPQMAWWQFAPNAFVGMQQGWQVIYPFSGWDQPPGTTAYLRRRVVISSESGGRLELFPRRKEVRTPPARPAGDTSNDERVK